MKESRPCAGCKKHFHPRPQSPDQRFCSEANCQKERRRRWQALKRENDPDYRENQARAQAKWAAANPSYWSDYRERHPDYVTRNRERQRERDAGRRVTSVLAKSDAWMVRITEVSRPWAATG